MSSVWYPAGKSRHFGIFLALQAAGCPLEASWLTWEPNWTGEEPTREAYAEHVQVCLREASERNVLLYAEPSDKMHLGSFPGGLCITLAWSLRATSEPMALGFSQEPPTSKNCNTLADAVRAIKAQEAGEDARQRAPGKPTAKPAPTRSCNLSANTPLTL